MYLQSYKSSNLLIKGNFSTAIFNERKLLTNDSGDDCNVTRMKKLGNMFGQITVSFLCTIPKKNIADAKEQHNLNQKREHNEKN